MPRQFEITNEITVSATPEEVWEAIATGPGVDSWFMGRNEIEPREGGTARMTMAGQTDESTVTTWDPPRRFVTRSPEGPDGQFMAFEYLVEGRGSGSTVVRLVHSGYLGDDWEAEYDALTKGDRMYLNKLGTYLTHFRGRTSTFASLLVGPQVADADRAWKTFTAALGVADQVEVGDRARTAIDGLPPVDGTVDYVDPHLFLGVRTDDALYRLGHGMGMVFAEYHVFSADIDQEATDRAWQAWLAAAFA
jgi:uncharacterized protein YndB with AHSA1/START domain